MSKIIILPTNEEINPWRITGWNYLCDNIYYHRLFESTYPECKLTPESTFDYAFYKDHFTVIADGKYKLDVKYNDPHLNNSSLWLD